MGIYSEYLDKQMSFESIVAERKRLISEISALRGNRDVLVYASDLNKGQAQISIDYTDIMPFQDQLANLKGDSLDIILETPGGFAEVVEDIVKLVRGRYKNLGIIIPGYSKSAGTIFAMAADEILMGPASALGPIDAQIATSSGKRFSAEAFLEGLRKIKEEVQQKGLNLAYVPILQNISPGEIQHCENAQKFSQRLVSEWLVKFKFKDWATHSTTGAPVTKEEKAKRAEEIGERLCNHSKWLTHGRSIKIEDFAEMKLKITDYSKNAKLSEAITRYYTLLRMTFDQTSIYKLFETSSSQIMRFVAQQIPLPGMMGMPPVGLPGMPIPDQIKSAKINVQCPKCRSPYTVQANLEPNTPLESGVHPYPFENNNFACLNCGTNINLLQARLQIEAQTGKKLVK